MRIPGHSEISMRQWALTARLKRKRYRKLINDFSPFHSSGNLTLIVCWWFAFFQESSKLFHYGFQAVAGSRNVHHKGRVGEKLDELLYPRAIQHIHHLALRLDIAESLYLLSAKFNALFSPMEQFLGFKLDRTCNTPRAPSLHQ
jgi:hypothetical protein